MIRPIFLIFGTLFFATLVFVGAAQASQAELQEAYTAYQEAAARGDVRGALPHAQRAYELGAKLYGADSQNTALLAFNLGDTLYQLTEFRDAVEPLRVAVDGLGRSSDMYDLAAFQMASALIGARQNRTAREFIEQRLLQIQARHSNDPQLEARWQLLHAESVLRWVYRRVPRVDSWKGKYVAYAAGANREYASRMLRDVYSTDYDNNRVIRDGLSRLETVRRLIETGNITEAEFLARYNFALGRYHNYRREFDDAEQALMAAARYYETFGYTTDDHVELYAELVFATLNRREFDRVEALAAEGLRLANLRCYGGAILMVPILPILTDSNLNGYATMRFSIDEAGSTSNIERVREPGNFTISSASAETAVEQFIFAPSRSQCESLSDTPGEAELVWLGP